MKRIEKALSNDVFLKNETSIYKRYLDDKFKRTFNNQEKEVLTNIRRYYKEVEGGIEMNAMPHESFEDDNISGKDLKEVALALKYFWRTPTDNISQPGFFNVIQEMFELDDYESSVAAKAKQIMLSGEQVVLHNDVVEGNLLKVGGGIILIDFEYSGLGNKIFDVGSFLTERELTEEQREEFIGHFEDIDLDDLEIVEEFLQIFWSKWANYKYESTNREIYETIRDWKVSKIKRNLI